MGEVRFMISEAAKQVHVESHVLRYWEEELELVIGRTEMGHRYYTEDDIQLFCCIKKLKDAGMLLKDLKPLIPELKSTKLKLQKTEALKKAALKKETAASTVSAPAAVSSPAAVSTPAAISEAEVVPVTQLEQVRSLIGDVLTEVVVSNNEELKKDISKSVTTDVIREMDFLFQAKERQEEEHFRKLDTLIRQQQANRKEAAREHPLGRLKNMFNHC
ncbi:helix-turn-helix domain-containing protein [Mediterraneibacter gnavus]|uniref:helix-turn-helix domain-containing protein n=1 Tax=Mediterraneibacter gnavus TaxID=33038 RepID=UPI002330A5FB|nr:helix-turn-helix domain-containing protein [Mediterraneibacter gnavus]MDB8683786.1 helix-turn-helix domain-containing protein [Mediterraneibacter gnavus]MDB8694425.1 helix-turn-helix domain-containing protein [Mediterraneibacter gnavus]MDB8700720.1 helix-turn-helix domain-containing protein [Mediterraneibacter gnavus]